MAEKPEILLKFLRDHQPRTEPVVTNHKKVESQPVVVKPEVTKNDLERISDTFNSQVFLWCYFCFIRILASKNPGSIGQGRKRKHKTDKRKQFPEERSRRRKRDAQRWIREVFKRGQIAQLNGQNAKWYYWRSANATISSWVQPGTENGFELRGLLSFCFSLFLRWETARA